MFGFVERAGVVELEGVVDEGSAEKVTPDQNATPTEPCFGRERIGGTEMPRGGLMRGNAHGPKYEPVTLPASLPAKTTQDNPRPKGSVQVKATAWSP